MTHTKPELPPRIDWWRVIVELSRAGYSADRVADEMLKSRAWVYLLKNDGAEPRYRDGVMLIALWSKATGKDPNEAPRGVVVGDGARERFRLSCK